MRPTSVLFTLAAFLGGGPAHNPSPAPLLGAYAQLFPGDPEHLDYYCGWDWLEANANCEYHCPSGLDEDCPPLPNGRKRRCLAAAGCFVRFRKIYWTGVISLSFDKEDHLGTTTTATVTGTGSTEAPVDDGLMTKEEQAAFEASFADYLFEALKEQMQIAEVSVEEQMYDKPCVQAAFGGADPSTTSLDMVVKVVGEYIPVGDKFFTDEQLGEEVLALVSDDPASFLTAVKNSSSFFEAVTGIAAIEEDAVVESPSASPSEPPSRGSEQIFDIRIDPRPTGSYGLVFNVRTPRDMPSILITAMSFVTLHEGPLEYEVYSKLGSYEKFIGKNSWWELIASGQTVGKGNKEYTRILSEDTVVEDAGDELEYLGFQPVHVPGDRGTRSFYITLTKRYKTKEDGPIPVLFSYPLGDKVEGERAYEMVDSTPELEVWEGDGVLDYPWPTDRNGPYYRRPRGFIGHFDYDRHPCYPLTNFTGWPCPYVAKRPTGRPTGKPTVPPTPPPVTRRPTRDPTEAPTARPDSAVPMETNGEEKNETEAPELVAPPGPEVTPDAPKNDATLTVGVEEDATSSGAPVLWKHDYRSCYYYCGLLVIAFVFLGW